MKLFDVDLIATELPLRMTNRITLIGWMKMTLALLVIVQLVMIVGCKQKIPFHLTITEANNNQEPIIVIETALTETWETIMKSI